MFLQENRLGSWGTFSIKQHHYGSCGRWSSNSKNKVESQPLNQYARSVSRRNSWLVSLSGLALSCTRFGHLTKGNKSFHILHFPPIQMYSYIHTRTISESFQIYIYKCMYTYEFSYTHLLLLGPWLQNPTTSLPSKCRERNWRIHHLVEWGDHDAIPMMLATASYWIRISTALHQPGTIPRRLWVIDL